MHIAVSRSRPAVVHAAVVGELDLATAPRLAAALDAELVATPRLMTVDLSGVGFCSAAGLSALLRIEQRADDVGAAFRWRNCSPPVRRIVHLAGLSDALDRPGRRWVRHDETEL